ncbi:MAG: glycoside hydrolase family 19 protein, partial [Polynucleobacter sp.]
NETFDRFGIDSIKKQAAFIGQCGHECGNFRVLEENLNYRAETLCKLWPKRFPTLEFAKQYERQPKKIANSVYSNRMGNRDEASGDGFRFRGRGCIQLTGHSSYFHAGKALGVDFVMEPDLVASPKYAALTAGWFWSTHDCNALAQAADWVKLTKKINGGTIGLQDRIKHTEEALAVLQS